jgi:hypothetical protein
VAQVHQGRGNEKGGLLGRKNELGWNWFENLDAF